MNDTAAARMQAKIHRHIPLSQTMAYRIVGLDGRHIVVEAPLAPNVNIHGTGFAGSIYALGILTAWAMVSQIIDEAGLDAELVVSEAGIRYRAPIQTSIQCRAAVTADRQQAFVEGLRKDGRARIDVRIEIGDGPAAVLEATLHARCSREVDL